MKKILSKGLDFAASFRDETLLPYWKRDRYVGRLQRLLGICQSEIDTIMWSFTRVAMAMTPDEILGKCIDTIPVIDGLRCLPAMEDSVGYHPPVQRDATFATTHPCGDDEIHQVISAHPAQFRKAVEVMTPHFQTRNLDFARGAFNRKASKLYESFSLSRWIFGSKSKVPKICLDESVSGICWVFTECVTAQLHDIKGLDPRV